MKFWSIYHNIHISKSNQQDNNQRTEPSPKPTFSFSLHNTLWLHSPNSNGVPNGGQLNITVSINNLFLQIIKASLHVSFGDPRAGLDAYFFFFQGGWKIKECIKNFKDAMQIFQMCFSLVRVKIIKRHYKGTKKRVQKVHMIFKYFYFCF